MLRSLFLASLLLLTPAVRGQTLPADQAALKAHVQFLASDAMKGREAGTPEFDIAAEYAAAQMLAAGLKPGVGGKWFQPVRLVTYQAADHGTMVVKRGKVETPLAFAKDFIRLATPRMLDLSIEAPMVFVGYGVTYPQGGIDDYAGLDVRGKIVVVLAGLPTGLPGEVEAHIGDIDETARNAAAHGAVGLVSVESASRRTEFPFEAAAGYWNYPRTTAADPQGVAMAPAVPTLGFLSMPGAEKLFAGAKIRWVDVLAAERKGTRLPRGPLSATLAVTGKTQVESVDSRNVVGLLEGADPTLKSQYVVLSAHLDHVGIGEAVNGDTIYNGALDNALGVSTVLEAARAFQKSGERPKRSILFVALTAEEKGLIGSEYFAHYPPVPRDALVADLNLDMPILTYRIEDLVVLGGERSSLGPILAQAAAGEGLKVVPDPAPEEMFFVRSDHYSFVKAGVPAVSVDSGPGGPGAVAQREFLDKHYHKPSDQIDLPIDWASAAKFLRVNYAAARAMADNPERPRWNKGDFFGLTFGGYGAR